MDTVEPKMPSPPTRPLPPGACDAHTHVFGPYDRFPFMHSSSYAAPDAPFELHAAMLSTVGAAHGVVVQPAPYGSNHDALTDALIRSAGRLRGVGVAAADVSDRDLERLHLAGVRALRFSEVLDQGTGKRFLGSVGVDQLELLASRMVSLGWHAQIWARNEDVPALVRRLAPLRVPFVFEHMTSVTVGRGIDDAAFRETIALLADGRMWVKLALCRNSKQAPDYEDLRPFHDALVEANPARLLWASDWPFVRMGDAAPDVGHLIDVFDRWTADDAIRRAILVDNPARLYGFDPETGA